MIRVKFHDNCFIIAVTISQYLSDSKCSKSGCNEYVTRTTIPEEHADANRPYVWAFKTNGNILLTTYEDITNPTSFRLGITTNSSAGRGITMNVFDSGKFF